MREVGCCLSRCAPTSVVVAPGMCWVVPSRTWRCRRYEGEVREAPHTPREGVQASVRCEWRRKVRSASEGSGSWLGAVVGTVVWIISFSKFVSLSSVSISEAMPHPPCAGRSTGLAAAPPACSFLVIMCWVALVPFFVEGLLLLCSEWSSLKHPACFHSETLRLRSRD